MKGRERGRGGKGEKNIGEGKGEREGNQGAQEGGR